MRYIRQTMNLKENKENSVMNEKDKQKIDELKLQIKSAYAQANMLKQSNKKLLWKMEYMEKQMQNHQQIKEQLQFLREQENRYKQQLANHDQINQKLRQQLQKVEREKNELAQRLKQMILDEETKNSFAMQSNRSDQTTLNLPQTIRIQDYRSTKFPREASSRTSVCMSIGNQKSKQNHHSTPKSKIQININQIIPQNINHKKKVFF